MESFWQEGVGIAKDNIVIKNGVTLAGNIMSNTIFLVTRGVPVKDMVSHQQEALSELNHFMAEVKEKTQLQRRLQAYDNLSAAELQQTKVRIARLNDNLANNAVRELIDEGIFQSIAEDIDATDSIYGARGKLTRALEPFANKLPGYVMGLYRYGYMTHDTAPYKLLFRGTQYSDFVARYALFKHNINTRKMSKDAALKDIIESFINYDIPTSKEMQYLNDMGFFMFTKFLFRIQRVIFRLYKEKPATAITAYSIQEILGEYSDIPDSNLLTSSVLDRLNTPAETADAFIGMPGVDLIGNILD